MLTLDALSGIQHLLGDDARLLVAAEDRHSQTVIVVDTGTHREGAGRYVTWILGHENCCLLGHYVNDRLAAIHDFLQRSFVCMSGSNEERE